MNLANKITIIRILLIPFFIACLIYYTPEADYLRFIALVIFVISVLTDAIDGYVARKYYQKTRLGTFLDPMADKLLLVSAYISLSMIVTMPQEFRIPAWVLIIVITRDMLLVMGAIIIHMIKGEIEIKPMLIGKITTAFQMITIIAVLLQFKYSYALWIPMVGFTVASGIGYLVRANHLLNESSPSKTQETFPRKEGLDESQ